MSNTSPANRSELGNCGGHVRVAAGWAVLVAVRESPLTVVATESGHQTRTDHAIASPLLRIYPTFTGTSVIVSLPKMSITLTATV